MTFSITINTTRHSASLHQNVQHCYVDVHLCWVLSTSLLCWVSLCWMSLRWVSLCWMLLCWVSWHWHFDNVMSRSNYNLVSWHFDGMTSGQLDIFTMQKNGTSLLWHFEYVMVYFCNMIFDGTTFGWLYIYTILKVGLSPEWHFENATFWLYDWLLIWHF
jgi:hypothetical protein